MAKINSMIKSGEAAKLLGVSQQTLRAWHKKGYLVPDFTPESGTRMYSLARINNILAGRHGQQDGTAQQ